MSDLATQDLRSADNDLTVTVSGVLAYIDQIDQKMTVLENQITELKAQASGSAHEGLSVAIEQAAADVRNTTVRLSNALPTAPTAPTGPGAGVVPAEGPEAEANEKARDLPDSTEKDEKVADAGGATATTDSGLDHATTTAAEPSDTTNANVVPGTPAPPAPGQTPGTLTGDQLTSTQTMGVGATSPTEATPQPAPGQAPPA